MVIDFVPLCGGGGPTFSYFAVFSSSLSEPSLLKLSQGRICSNVKNFTKLVLRINCGEKTNLLNRCKHNGDHKSMKYLTANVNTNKISMDTSGNCSAHLSAESPSNISPNPS